MNKIIPFLKGIIKLSTIFAQKIYEKFLTLQKNLQYAILGFCFVIFVAIFLWPSALPIKDAVNEMELLAGNIRRLYQNRPDYWGLNTMMVLDKKIYPNKMKKNDKLVSVLGNEILVGDGVSGSVLMPGSRNFDITYRGLSKKQCVQLVSHEFDSSFWLVIMGITIAHLDNQQLFTWDDPKYKLPISKANAKKFCKDGSAVIWHND